MKTTFCRLLVLSCALIFTSAALAQSQQTDHTYVLDNPENRVPGTLDDVAWLVGSWAGEAFGGTFEETWNPASLGTMVGMFKVMGDGEISFYELMLLAEEEGSLSLKVKHFSADFAAWEDKEDYLNFRLVKAEDAAVHFSGLSFYRINDDEMHSYLTFRDGDSVREEKLVYRRVAP
jgi:hypothetical protein